jgi:hypothetical protein
VQLGAPIRLGRHFRGTLTRVKLSEAFLMGFLLLAMGGLTAAIFYMNIRVMRDAPAQLGQHLPGARRRAMLAGLGVIALLAIEVGLFLGGRSAGGPALGGGLAAAGIVVLVVVGFVFAVRDDMKRGNLPS